MRTDSWANHRLPVKTDRCRGPWRWRLRAFKGRAEVCESGPEFDFVAEALWRREGRQYPVKAVVKVTVEQAPSSPLAGLHVQRQSERGRC
jgi:hypothetical protein